MTEDEILFRDKQPRELPVAATLQLIEEYGEIVSMGGRPAAIDGFLVAFVSRKDALVGPLVLNSVVARELCKLLIDEGYGPEDNDQSR